VFPAARDAQVLIEGHVERAGSGFHAQLRMTRGDGTLVGSRELSSQRLDCHELSETLGVVLAVMIDPDAEGRVRAPEPPPAARPRPPAAKPAARYPDANRLLAFTRVLVAVVPKTNVGVGAAYERALGVAGGLRIEGVSFFGMRLKKAVDGAPEAAVDLRLAYGGLAYCPLWLTLSRLRLAGCAGLEVGAMRAQGVNLKAPARDRAQVWLSGSASLRLAVRLVAALELSFGGSFVGTSKHSYVASIEPVEPAATHPKREVIAHAPSFGAAFDLGLGARF
jgi:hypothetical protein